MKNIYPLARIWRYLLIVLAVGLVTTFLSPILSVNFSGKASDLVWATLIVGGVYGAYAYGELTSKIITSPAGIETVAFGIRLQATWDKVERVDINPFGFVNLFFKESLYKSKLVNALLRPFAYDRTIQLSPYIDDLATSDLLKDIAKYVPNSHTLELIAENTSSTRTFQKVGTIGLYYSGVLPFLVPLTFLFQRGSETLKASGFANATVVYYIMISSVMLSLFFNGIGLLGYNAEISELPDPEISHKARTYYLSPVVTLLLGFGVGAIIGAVLQSRSIIVEREQSFLLVAFLLAAVSLRVSGAIERLIFKDDLR
ncbi:MAG: hypothetical protein BWY63_02052 [Chloroflexi bacterium ADurb.Bin360]|nr:MAG: hypothetical protein BWY63_02052 [Chloroflexi bacterium ADurb.Bin360]